jgi:lysophospholipid acyltransferase (LPLAT)-like uncharacterized protein
VRLKVSPESVQSFAAPAMRVLARTWRIRTEHEERWRQFYDVRRAHVFVLWHEVILPLLWHHRGQGHTLIVSEAREGQYLVDFARSLGYRAVRGSGTRGAARALLGAVRELREGHTVAFTPDGPRGPRREMKAGVVAAAQRAGTTVLPVHARAARAWRLNSWDRFMIPKIGARVTVTYGRPFEVADGEAGLAAGVREAIDRLQEIAGPAE